jgi:hypothetical protein
VDPFLSPYFAVTRLPGVPILRVVRSPRPFTSLSDLAQAWEEMNRALDNLGRSGCTLLTDLRLVTGRNDPAFEKAVAAHRLTMQRGFSRIAVIVGSPAGLLQVRRLALEDGSPSRGFLDAQEAIDWLCEAARPKRAR